MPGFIIHSEYINNYMFCSSSFLKWLAKQHMSGAKTRVFPKVHSCHLALCSFHAKIISVGTTNWKRVLRYKQNLLWNEINKLPFQCNCDFKTWSMCQRFMIQMLLGIYTVWAPRLLFLHLFNRCMGHGMVQEPSAECPRIYRVYCLTPPTSLCSSNKQNLNSVPV